MGPAIERAFPDGINVEQVECSDSGSKHWVRVWERGAGFTLACGSGAMASAIGAAVLGSGKPGKFLMLELPGGKLRVKVSKLDLSNGTAEVVMEGPAEIVFHGKADI